MSRVKRGINTRKRHKRLLKQTKGYYGQRKNVFCRAKETLRKLYGEGISSPSQLETVKEKKRKTFIKKYGVDNIRKWKPFYEYIKSVIESKYNTDYAKFVSNNSKKVWDSKTDDEKNKWLNDSIHSDSAKTKSLSNRNGFIVSKIEDVVSKILSELNIIHTRQYILKYKYK